MGRALGCSRRAPSDTHARAPHTPRAAAVAQPRVAKEKLVFGQTTTDHMLEVDWDAEKVWRLRVF